jgi:predicted DNA-binding protein YlxM (UPF0122 family)
MAHAGGRPPKLTKENRVKILELAALDASVAEMAMYCNVSKQTVYNWLDGDKELFDEVERLRETPILAIRRSILEKAHDSYQNGMDYLKRKRKAEFGDESTVNHNLPTPLLDAVQRNHSNAKSDGDAQED